MKPIERVQIVLRLRLRRPLRPLVGFLKFFYYDTPYVDGPRDRVKVGTRCGLANTLFNTASGRITVGDNVAFGYNVMLLTGRHLFVGGVRASLSEAGEFGGGWGGGSVEVPDEGYDISIGSGCWIGSGVIVSGGVTIGPNSVIGAGSVVLKSCPEGSFVAGVPARVLRRTDQ